MTATVLDVVGVVCLAAFCWLVWEPAAALLPVGVACLVASWVLVEEGGES
jgi:hypothetical protein